MPDITMCQNHYCYVREKCFRYTATPSYPMQSYSIFDYDDSQGKCFIDTKTEQKAFNNPQKYYVSKI